MRKTLSILGLVMAFSPLAAPLASARSIDQLEAATLVKQSFEDGTITGRIVGVHPFVSPNGTEYRQSDVVTRRLANYRANSSHCVVKMNEDGKSSAVCKTPWNGR